jgi:quercetin dioxygenase-like cupin family protein
MSETARRARASVQLDNARVRVTEWRFGPGEATGHHRHELDYVVVPLTTGRLESRGADGVSVAELETGRAYFRSAGVEHDVRNANAFEFAFVEIEIKAGG